MPTVSVIIPNYNHARYLRRRIDSVLGQTYTDFEVILLDDCSKDESRSIIREYVNDSRVRIEFNEKNSRSTFKQWNKGVRMARGQYVWIAESDDYADKRLLERLVTILDGDPAVAFAYCRSWYVSSNDHLNGFADCYLEDLDLHRWTADYCGDGLNECRNYLVIYNTIPNGSAAIFRKALYERVGGADETLRLCGDWKLWAAMALAGKVAYVSEPLNYFRFHGDSVRSETSRHKIDVMETLQVVRWLLDRVTPAETARRKMFARLAKLWVPAVMSTHVPLHVKSAILKTVRTIDPNLIRHAISPALATCRLKVERHFPFMRVRS